MNKIRGALSELVNRHLDRLGYALVRTRGNEHLRRFVSHEGRQYAYEPIVSQDVLAPWATDKDFLAVWKQIKSSTLVDKYRCYELYQSVRSVAPLGGDIVEVGVWRGGTGALLASAANKWKPNAQIWLCDTFEGVVKAGELDNKYRGGEHGDTSQETVERLLVSMGIRNANVLRGIFPDQTSHLLENRQIALLHLDVDSYRSASDVLTWAAPRLARGGVVIVDDYGFSSCVGITRLIDDLRGTGEWLWFFNLNRHAILVKR
jgi:O-methyltransferase